MIDGRQLLADLQPLRKRLEDDLRERSEQLADLGQRLREEWQTAREQERTAQTYEAWREDTLAQAAVMWLLAGVFVRFLEDNELIDQPRLAGTGDRLQLARDQRTLYFQAHPHDSDRDYLYSVFEAVAALSAAAPLFDHRHNPIWNIGISGDAATQVIDFWQRIDPASGALVHDFTDPDWQTRFLGDLYQDLSESARKKYALLQTPGFVLQFILDRTLTPAIQEFGFREVRLIDPACGSGHFLLAAFERLIRLWAQHEPGGNSRDQAQRALAQISGVDLNPFAVAIARFRLLLAALKASNITWLVDAPAFEMELAAGDSLLHGPRPGDQGARQMYLDAEVDPLAHVYATEDAEDLKRILGGRYHAVVGNPPYITPKDSALNEAYRSRFGSCHMKYSLAVPFMERFFDLAVENGGGEPGHAGYVGMITANSFMKREFGKKLIEQFIPKWDLTHMIDTSVAYIPGHGTPTVILFGRHRRSVAHTVRAVLGIRGEPTPPDDPSRGVVWSAMLEQVDRPGSASPFLSVSDAPRGSFHAHPWSIGGGGAAELKASMDAVGVEHVRQRAESIGFGVIIAEDDAFVDSLPSSRMRAVPDNLQRAFVRGEDVRDWSIRVDRAAIFPYTEEIELRPDTAIRNLLWPYRTLLWARPDFSGGTYRRCGRPYWEYHQIPRERNQRSTHIAFSSVSTHNHFALVRGRLLFDRHAPLITLKRGAADDEHLALVGLLNSSAACFWLKQVMSSKGLGGQGGGIKPEDWHRAYEFDGSKVGHLPIPPNDAALSTLAREMSSVMAEVQQTGPASVLSEGVGDLRARLADAGRQTELLYRRAVAIQEELDWLVYSLYGLTIYSPAPDRFIANGIAAEHRPVELLFRDSLESGEESHFYNVHAYRGTGVMAFGELPADVQECLFERKRRVATDARLRLIESLNYKRRWQVEPWKDQVDRALMEWLLDCVESERYRFNVALTSIARLAELARQDAEFMHVAVLYRGHDDFEVSALVAELVESAAVPFLPVLRYKASGLRKHEQWERTWDLQRREDAINARVRLPDGDSQHLTADEAAAMTERQLGDISVPPKYTAADFADGAFWQLRGKLDVPKERFISYPRCERDADATPVIAWAAWDRLKQAKALATYYVQMKESEGWNKERLTPLLAGLLELLPWLRQWHNEIDPEYGQRMGEFYDGFVDEEARALGLTREAIRAWTPRARAVRQRRRGTQQTGD